MRKATHNPLFGEHDLKCTNGIRSGLCFFLKVLVII